MCLNRSMDKPKSKKIHLALSVKNLDEVVKDYNKRLGSSPEVFIPNEYALWRTNEVNLSVRVDPSFQPGSLLHLGFEDPSVDGFTSTIDSIGIVWESFRAQDQLDEINSIWPEKKEQ